MAAVQSSWADEIEEGDSTTLPMPSETIQGISFYFPWKLYAPLVLFTKLHTLQMFIFEQDLQEVSLCPTRTL